MAFYLPMMFDTRGKHILVVGGGAIAHEKLTRIVDLSAQITVVAKEYAENTKQILLDNGIKYKTRGFKAKDLDGIDIVIAAVDDAKLQQKIYKKASKRKILCNAVDLADYCHFIFPSIIRKGDLVLSISTSGASPAMAKYLKKAFESYIPHDIEEFLQLMRQKRSELPKGKERMKILDEIAREYINTNFGNKI